MFFTFILISSAADRDLSKHKVEGDTFIQGRASFREQYGAGDRKLNRKETLDGYVSRVASNTFEREQYTRFVQENEDKSMPHRTRGESYEKSARVSRKTVGHSYADWTEGKHNSKESGGGSVIAFIVFLTIVIIIVRKFT